MIPRRTFHTSAAVAVSAAALAWSASAASGATTLFTPPASGTTACGVAGAKRVASSGQLVVITAPKSDPTVGRYTDVEACIGSHRPRQLDVLDSVDGPCRLRSALATSGRYVGLDIRCLITVLDQRVDTIRSFDVARGRGLYGADRSGAAPALEDARAGFVLATNGAFAWIEDFGSHTDVIACDRRAPCNDGTGNPSRGLDRARGARDLGGLRVTATTVSWRHGGKRRSARLR